MPALWRPSYWLRLRLGRGPGTVIVQCPVCPRLAHQLGQPDRNGIAMLEVQMDGEAMTIDNDRIDEAVLARLRLGLHDKYRAWKGFDWDVMNWLHEKGYISDPVGKAKSVVFTEEGLRRSAELFRQMFMIETG